MGLIQFKNKKEGNKKEGQEKKKKIKKKEIRLKRERMNSIIIIIRDKHLKIIYVN